MSAAGEITSLAIGTPIVRLGRVASGADGAVWIAEAGATRSQLGFVSASGASLGPSATTGRPRRRRARTTTPTAASASVVTGTVNAVSTNGAVERIIFRAVVVGGLFQLRPRYSKL